MSNNDAHIDRKIAEKMNGLSVQPPERVWEGIQAGMFARQRQRRMLIVRWSAAAAVLLLVLAAGWWWSARPVRNEVLVEVEQGMPDVSKRLKTPSQGNSENVSDSEAKTVVALAENSSRLRGERGPGTGQPKKMKLHRNSPETSNVGHEVERVPVPAFLLPIKRIVLSDEDAVVADGLMGTDVARQENELQFDSLLMAQYAGLLKREEQKVASSKWMIGAYLSPGYGASVQNYSAAYLRNLNAAQRSGGLSLGGGISVQYKAGKRLTMETGVFYARNGKTDRSNLGDLFASSPDYALAPGVVAGAAQNRGNEVIVSEKGMKVFSPAGVVRIQASGGVEKAPSYDATSGSYPVSLEGELLPVFDMLEIPLLLRYDLFRQGIIVSVLGGGNIGLVTSNTVYLSSYAGSKALGEVEDISTLNWSVTVGFGVRYPLGRNLSLAVEPRYNYYLNSLNRSSDVDFRPYRIGVYSGITYSF